MDNMDIAKGLIFKNLNIISKNSLDDRVIIQKKIYLLQQKGIDLGYGYNWYLKGPYSPALTSYVYENLDSLNSMEYGEVALNKEVLSNIDEINDLRDTKPNNLSVADWYELLASMLYIYENHYMWGIEAEFDEITKILMHEKPKYSKADANLAFKKLIEFRYIDGE